MPVQEQRKVNLQITDGPDIMNFIMAYVYAHDGSPRTFNVQANGEFRVEIVLSMIMHESGNTTSHCFEGYIKKAGRPPHNGRPAEIAWIDNASEIKGYYDAKYGTGWIGPKT